MNRLIKILGGCDLKDIASLRDLYDNNQGNSYYMGDIEIQCSSANRFESQKVEMKILYPWESFGISFREGYFQEGQIAAADYFLRQFIQAVDEMNKLHFHRTRNVIYNGWYYIQQPDNRVVPRNGSYFNDKNQLCLTFQILFPIYFTDRRHVVEGGKSVKMMRKEVFRAITNLRDNYDINECQAWLNVAYRQKDIRESIRKKGYVAFIANGSILPREEDTDNAKSDAVPFQSPLEDEIQIQVFDSNISGMGIQKGVSVITGGGYSGKSTILNAMLNGVYNHKLSDGREYCVCDQTAIKIAAEDGRPITNIDISPFIKWIPNDNPKQFYSKHASGSTSQAANIMEAIYAGCKLLLIDEDKTATNFMIRDARMKRIIPNDPIIPFTNRVRDIYEQAGVSTILIIGGNSEYIDVADHIYIMQQFNLKKIDHHDEKFAICDNSLYKETEDYNPQWSRTRAIKNKKLTLQEAFARKEHISVIECEYIEIDKERIDIKGIETIKTKDQANAIALFFRYIHSKHIGFEGTLYMLNSIEDLSRLISQKGLDILRDKGIIFDFCLEMPRTIDIYAVWNRFRNIDIESL